MTGFLSLTLAIIYIAVLSFLLYFLRINTLQIHLLRDGKVVFPLTPLQCRLSLRDLKSFGEIEER